MKDFNELLYLLALTKVAGIGNINAKKLISHLGSAESIFKEKKILLSKINGIGTFTIQNLHDPEVLEKAEKEIKYIEKNKIEYSVFSDENYPEKLKHCIDSPLVLFQEGKIELKNRPIISIVGTRNMTVYGRDFIEKLISNIKVYNPVIVSGFAYGVDIQSHKSAMGNQLQTIGVLAHGLEDIYPKTHKKYMADLLENGGFYTEYWHDESPLRENFLQRNRIIAGLSEATIIIESAEKGGSLVTAEMANNYNREVFAVPGRISDTYSKGCNNLIKTHKAQLLEKAEDLIYYLNWDSLNPKAKKIEPQLFIDLTGDDRVVFDFLDNRGKNTLDSIAIETKIPIYKLSGILLNLELLGLIKPLPGKYFEKI